ncbi:IucA/IucC family C-terminal-domain containing protein [Salinisphaera sp. Q1T1-3]|uniref:IucA/IucC family C-terminal-domain containing protein n=1 Tax=Salinisphaera sp. Q1T1-3 TaxID=2321229 RepID=UPI000E76ACCC|nr:IucA/IucC family C-terminal-domain containing protein [Salinisphaera sp. Q1T1-3]RJS94401.1 siderophore-iron reductase, Fe-S cluster protein [Salinisphaera sp. Q1T1-3]
MSAVDFTPVQWEMLGGTFGLTEAARADARSIEARALHDHRACRGVLDRLAPMIGTTDVRVAASLWSKRLAFLATGCGLYALSVCDRGLDLSPANCVIEYARRNDRWTAALPLHVTRAERWAPGDRLRARQRLVEMLFGGLLAPLWRVLHETSGVSLRMLWENAAVRVYSLYDRRFANPATPEIARRCDADFRFLLDLSPAVFGLDYNPLARFRRPRVADRAGRRVRFRRTCCLYYLATRPPEYCAACPLVDPKRGGSRS